MILPIDDKYRVAGDRYNWMIQERRGIRSGEVRWESVAWFPELSMAVTHLHRLMVRTSDAKTLAEALALAEKATATVVRALTPSFEVKEKPGTEAGSEKCERIETCASIAE